MNRPDQKRLYLLSGNGSTKRWWATTLPYFKEIEAIPLELPGFGDNTDDRWQSMDELAEALIDMTEEGSRIFAVGVNGLVVLRALVKKPDHFAYITLLAPVGAFLWERRFVKLMSPKPIRATIHFLLRNYPKIFKRKFSSQTWTDEQYAMMGEGYRKCKAFQRYFDIVKAESALDFFDQIKTPIELIWGTRDAVLNVEQAAAWDSILPRSELTITLKDNWEHYPYIDDPEEFANYMQHQPTGFRAHSKAGRLRLAQLAGIDVPALHTVKSLKEYQDIASQISDQKLYALRSSNWQEDHIDSSQAGLNTTYIRVKKADIPQHLHTFFEDGMAAVIIQEFVEPVVSGVAFVRKMSAEVEWVEGHLERLLEGTQKANSLILSKMKGDWVGEKGHTQVLEKTGLSAKKLETFLQNAIHRFHYQHSDIEWAWDGEKLLLLQIRPVTAHQWRRCLTSANLDEILPKKVSRAMEYAQRMASPHIGNVISRWDGRVLADREPFTVPYADASYINSDLFLSRFADWGLPSMLYAGEIGGAVPHLPFRLGKFLKNLPRFIKMGFVCRYALDDIFPALQKWEVDLEVISSMDALANHSKREAALMRWFTHYYLFIVRTNVLINSAISSSFGSFLGKAKTVYQDLNHQSAPHRIKYESDPATPRLVPRALAIDAPPVWGPFIKIMHRLGMPGLRGKYTEVREWFRDSNMRLFHRFHLEMMGSPYFEEHDGERAKSGTFWQDDGAATSQDFSFVVYPGQAEGVLGEDILLVDALEPGHYSDYQQAKAIISKSGGRLSHGATLLRELKKPSAVMSTIDADLVGEMVKYENGKLEKK